MKAYFLNIAFIICNLSTLAIAFSVNPDEGRRDEEQLKSRGKGDDHDMVKLLLMKRGQFKDKK